MGATPTPRRKCFTGCWTCRRRRVKCDQEKPICQRCRQLRVECEGYGVRLHWVTYHPDSPGDSSGLVEDQQAQPPGARASRSSLAGLTLAARHAPRLASPEIDAILERIDDCLDTEGPELAISAFSVFSLRSPAQHPSQRRPDLLAPLSSSVESSCHLSQAADHQSPGYPATRVVLQSSDSPRNHTPYDSQACTVESDYQLRLFNDLPLDPPPRTSRDIIPATETTLAQDRDDDNAVAEDSCGPARHLDALTMPSKQKRLIHHWITFTSSKLVLLDEPQNPCRTLMLPMALKGLVSVAESSNADIAIFHAICASAAYNLYELGGRASEEDHVLALRHDQQAIHYLRHNLAETNPHRAQSVAMAIMACIAVEAISGTTERWRTHVSGGLAYLARLFSQGVDKQLLSPFRHHMVKMAILCDFIVPTDLKSFLDDDTNMAVELEFTFPYYGVSRSFLRRQDYINSLIAPSNQSKQSAEEADAFELQMYLDFPSIPPPGLACTSRETHGLVVHHAAKAFYYAQLVYFQRSLRGSPLSAVQDLVGLGVAELESIGRGELGCVMLWPAIVLGSECGTSSNQARVSSWFRSQRRLGFRNLVFLEDLIAAVWKARSGGDAGGHDIGWRDIAAQNPAQFDVFRL